MKIDRKLILKLLEIFRPKYYNRLTWTVVIAGISLLSTSILEEIIRRLFTDKFHLDILNDNTEVFGLLLVSAGLLYNFGVHYLEIKKENLFRTDRQKEIEDNRNHDKLVFETSSHLMDENLLNDFLNILGGSHKIKDKYYCKVIEWTDFFSKTSNKYLISELETGKNKLLNDINELCIFTSFNFFSDDNNPEISYLQPDLNFERSRTGGGRTPEDMKQYDEITEKMNGLIQKVQKSYDNYRVTVKKNLKV